MHANIARMQRFVRHALHRSARSVIVKIKAARIIIQAEKLQRFRQRYLSVADQQFVGT